MAARRRGLRLLAAALPGLAAALLWPASGGAQAPTPQAEPPGGLDLYMPTPTGGRPSREEVTLGRRLFFERALSRDRSLACASCHQPRRAFTDGRRVARGVGGQPGPRNVPTLVNRGYGSASFWDGRATSLEVAVLDPIRNPRELDTELATVVARLRSSPSYVRDFQAAFETGPGEEELARALAGYVRSLLAGDSPFDRFTHGDLSALDERARRGRELFQGRARCVRCHHGPLLADERFHNTGVAWRSGAPSDSGRYLVTRDPGDLGAFKTPTLREVARTAPYMHDGSLATLEAVIEFYDRGGHPNPHLNPEIRPLRLTPEEKGALVAFLRTLSGRVREGVETGSR